MRSFQLLEQILDRGWEGLLKSSPGFRLQFLLKPADGLLQSGFGDRFEQLVHGFFLKGLHRKLVIGGHEDNPSLTRNPIGHREQLKKGGKKYWLTFQDGSLPSVWEEVHALWTRMQGNQRRQTANQGKKKIQRDYPWINEKDYKGHTIHWTECKETIFRSDGQTKQSHFVHLTNMSGTHRTIVNTQKNHGYKLEHKYSRKSYLAMKNYYQCLQIADIINQLLILSAAFQQWLTSKISIKHLWTRLLWALAYKNLKEKQL